MRTVIPHDAILIPDNAKRVFKGIIFDVYQWQQERFDGTMATFEMLKRPDTIEVLAIKDDKIVAVNDQQPGRSMQLMLPGGRHDRPEQTELECAKRELLEEIGMVFRDWRLIRVLQPLGKIEHFIYTFLATEFVEQHQASPDPGGEIIEIKELSFAEVKRITKEEPTRYWPVELFGRVNSLDELMALPEYK